MVLSRIVPSIATEIWIATALLQKEQPQRIDFTIGEIRERIEQEALTEQLRPGIPPHLYLHCVANLPPNPSRLRMLFATGKNTRRLYRPSDPYHPEREGGAITPGREALPERLRYLLDWYTSAYARVADAQEARDPILQLRGLGKKLSSDEHPDRYVERLRRGGE